jgi:hypothetical protein
MLCAYNCFEPIRSSKQFKYIYIFSIFSGYLSLMDDTGATRDDLKVPDGDVGDECNAATAEGRDIMVSYL